MKSRAKKKGERGLLGMKKVGIKWKGWEGRNNSKEIGFIYDKVARKKKFEDYWKFEKKITKCVLNLLQRTKGKIQKIKHF